MGTLISGSTGIDKIQDDAVDIADLSATGTASASTFLRGDNSWTAVDTFTLPAQSGNAGKFLTTDASTASWTEAGKILQVVSHTWSEPTSVSSTSYGSVGYSAASITPSATTSKILILVNFQAFIRYDAEGHQYASFKITRDTNTTVREFGRAIMEHEMGFSWAGSPPGNTAKVWGGNFGMSFLDSPSSTSSLEYALAMKCLTTASTGRVIVNEAGYEAASTITLMEIGA